MKFQQSTKQTKLQVFSGYFMLWQSTCILSRKVKFERNSGKIAREKNCSSNVVSRGLLWIAISPKNENSWRYSKVSTDLLFKSVDRYVIPTCIRGIYFPHVASLSCTNFKRFILLNVFSVSWFLIVDRFLSFKCIVTCPLWLRHPGLTSKEIYLSENNKLTNIFE